jgi:putative flippase GtrA
VNDVAASDSASVARKDPLLHLIGRHQLASFAATGVDYLLMIFVVSALGGGPVLGTVLGALCGAITNFTLGRHFTFRATARGAHEQAARYVVVSSGSLLWNAVGEHVLAVVLGVNYVIARVVVGLLVGLLWNFPMQRYFVFRH